MYNDAILAIDQGTTNTKAILLNRLGRIIAQGTAPLAISYPRPGWVEQSAEDIWSSVVSAVRQCLDRAQETQILAIGISNQRESVALWDSASGEPLGPAITWQCRRTAVETDRLKSEGHEAHVLAKTGLPLDPLFPASKFHWLLNLGHGPSTCIGTIDSWLIWKLTAGRCFGTDRSNASRTQLLNVQTGQWDEELCSLFGVDSSKLPTVNDSKHLFGHTNGVPGLADGIPITSAIGDSHAALFGHAAFESGEAKATFGTGSSVMMIAPEFTVPSDGMTTTIAWSIDEKITYALEGNILVSASLFPWAATLLGLDGDVDRLLELATSVEDTKGVVIVPALAGLGAPHWNPDARGILTGLSFASTPAHIARAAALSMPLQVVDVFNAMSRQVATPAKRIFVDGGPTRNRFLMQCLADLLNQPISICSDPELSALGAGLLAGWEIGFWSGLDEITALEHERVLVEPAMAEHNRTSLLTSWNEGVAQCVFDSKSIAASLNKL
ncbi:MAG: FGGY-family carbohydrate kinase [Granulosicoccus sp.]|nr:FGGY-family carbohydrate kinase [Granulosicoccus sp.]